MIRPGIELRPSEPLANILTVRPSVDHKNYLIISPTQNTETNPGDVWGNVVSQAPVGKTSDNAGVKNSQRREK